MAQNAQKKLNLKEDLHKLRRLWATQALNSFDVDAAKELTRSKSHKARVGALRALYYEAPRTEDLLPIAEAAVSDVSPQVRLWGVSLLAQLPSPDTVSIALRALEGVEVDDYLDFAVWSICREHRERWVGQIESKGGNPFASLSQLLFASSAIGEPLSLIHI